MGGIVPFRFLINLFSRPDVTFSKAILLLPLLIIRLAAAPADDAAGLEARLKETAEGSPPGAELMLQLIDLYEKDGQVFGLIRTAGKFSRAQAQHPQRAAVMLKLIEGYAASARHEDVITSGKQFLEIFPGNPLTNLVRERLATAYERTGRAALAATQLAEIWKNGGATEHGTQALELWMAASNAEPFKQAATLATAMVEKVPIGAALTGIGFQGMEAANRTEQWAEGLQITKTLARRNAPMDGTTQQDFHFRSGRFESQLGQHENAIGSFRKALGSKNPEAHRNLISAMVDGKKPPAEIEAEARKYLAAFPHEPDRYDPLARVAHAAAEAKDTSRALTLAEEVIQHDAQSHDIARAYVRWAAEDLKRAEKGLATAISENPSGASTLRAVLALDLYRDGMKDEAKARAMATEFLAKSPAEDGWTDEIVKFLYNSATSAEVFKEDLDLVIAIGKAFPQLAGFQDRLWTASPDDKERDRAWQQAKKDYQNDATVKLWRQTREDGGKSGQACKELLQKDYSPEIKHHLMARLAYVYRNHLGGNSKETSGELYQTLCQNFPKDANAATRWLEAAGYSKAPEMKLAAARHLLTLPTIDIHPDNWVRLIETKDEAIIRKAIQWITESTKTSAYPLYYATRIGDILAEVGMKNEALAWWKSRMDTDPKNDETISCALRVAATMEPAPTSAFLKPRYESAPEFQGAYAAEIANIAFKAGDLTTMETILNASRKREDEAPFTKWGMAEWPARGWMEETRNNAEWPAEKKARIFKIIRDLKLGRVSTEAGMELLAAAPKDMARLLQAQDLILMAEPHYESWNRLFPYAQSAMAREDYTLASAILNGLLNTIRSVGEKEMGDARTLLRKAYGKMGTIGADIPADSPIAPLLQIILHLRLGENELAEQAYYENKDLFDAHREELPIELILFAAETHISQGTPEDHERAEDILRGWMVKFGEAENVDVRDKARVQILLARNYQRASQYDIARAEFTTVLNAYKDQPEAIDARFGIGETYMAQKVYEQAGEIFTELAESPVPALSVRANFLLGVLALRQDNNEEARSIFLSVLESAPAAELANETLYNLAEVYGIEQRYLTQLETLRTVGRLGQESKLWQTPGNALPIVVQDPDLGISRGDTRIPVVVRTEPGNDEEKSFLTSGGAGKGIFLTEIPTAFGGAKPGDGILQVTGGDTITVDYPVDFKNQFQFEFLSNTRLRIASDADLKVASSEIVDVEDPTFTAKLKEDLNEEKEEQPRSASRPENQIKPGNLIYAQVKDGDRDLTGDPDTVAVKLTASSGDEVQFSLTEESQHGGIFSGAVRTGELPAGARASDSALDHSPLMAIDHDTASAWRSEPDGAAPKSLSIDMKKLRPVETVVLSSPDAENEAPVRMKIRGSHDGRFFYHLADFPTPEPPATIASTELGMQLRTYKFLANQLKETYTWQEIADVANKIDPTEKSQVTTMNWEASKEGEDAFFLIWSGKLVQERTGAMRIGVSGRTTSIMVDGRLELPPGAGDRTVDLWLEHGAHELVVFSIATPTLKKIEVLRAHENRQSAAVTMRPFAEADFKITEGLPKIEKAPIAEIKKEENRWTLTMPSRELRFVEFEFLEYRGEAIAVSQVEVSGGGEKHIPPAENVLDLASNDILELAPGDTVKISYLDELTAGNIQPNRLLEKSLTATYYNGEITPIGYDFAREAEGAVAGTRKEILRIEPGERIVAEVTDFDLDTGLDKDTVEIEVQVNAEPLIKIFATETEASSGVFTAEIDTSGEPTEGKISVKRGDKIYLRYKDEQNTFPGHAYQREAIVFVNEPSDGLVRILDSETPIEGAPHILPAKTQPSGKVEYALPLTVEVIDPDRAKDSRSTVLVELTTTQGTKAIVECVLSRAFASPDETTDDSRNPALLEGRFTGQVPMRLGGIESAIFLPADGTLPATSLGKIVSEGETSGKTQAGIHVFNVNGADAITASYTDDSRPDGTSGKLTSTATLASSAQLRVTDGEYVEDIALAHVGKKLFLMLTDPDRDISSDRDKALVRIVTASGEDETVELEETLSHSGVFSGSFPLVATDKPVPENFKDSIECFFGDEITVGYLDNVSQTPDGLSIIEVKVQVAVGTDGQMTAFSKVFKNENLAIQTQFHIAESHFELFKGHRKLKQTEEAAADLAAGRKVLRELQDEHPDPEYEPRISYLLGQFAQEMQAWNEAIAAYGSIVRNHPDHNLAPDSQYKLGQCYEEAGELDQALEAYVTLAATYPKSPLVANVMLRINEHFYTKEDYATAASVGAKFIERFPNHEWTPKMAFRIGQCEYKLEAYAKAGEAFDTFVKHFPDQELTAQGLFWAGESYRMANNIPDAFRRYNRCRWDFPETDAAKYSRGRLALPELLAQFEREANLDE